MGQIDKQKILNEIEKSSGGKIDIDTLKNASGKGDVSSLVSALPEEDKKKILEVLNDKQALSSLLKNPQISSLFNNFLGGGK